MKNFFKFILVILIGLSSSGCKKTPISKENTTPVIPLPATSKTYYVSPSLGSDANIGLAQVLAFKTLQKAASVTNPGDVVLLMDGVYNSFSGPVVTIDRSGTDGKYITYKPMPGANPKITASGNVWDAMIINGSYIIIEGLEFEGNNANLTLAGATKAFDDNIAGLISPDANYNTNAISIAKTGNPHHIIIRKCKVHDFPAGGIGAGASDYITIEGNTVYNNSWYTMYATSGISILGPKAIDANTGYKMIIRNNICYNNKTQVKWKAGSGNYRLSDGNGIIIDVNNGAQGTPVYIGRTLVENNVSYFNGGSGIHTLQCNRVDIINNTAYNNGQIVGYGEIFAQQSKDVKILNNIMYARTGGKVNENFGNEASTVIYDFNVYLGAFTIKGANDKVVDPQFNTLSTGANADFSLKLTSPAINAGTSTLFAPKDILGVARPKGSAVDCGAYEVN